MLGMGCGGEGFNFSWLGLWNCVFTGLTLLLLYTTCPVLANSLDPDQLASEEAN